VPFTLSHPAAVVPLRRIGLPMTAMVAGSMVPDVSLFLGWQQGYEYAHSLLGVVTVDVAATLVALWLWFTLIRDALVDLAPDGVRSRLAEHVTLAARQWWLVLPAASLGALTHVVWDAFTHRGRWGVREVAFLQEQHLWLPGYQWAQYVSGLLGLAVVCWAAARFLEARPPVRRRAPRPVWATGSLAAVAATAVAAGIATAAMNVGSGIHAMSFHGTVNAVRVGAVTLIAVCAVWRRLCRQPVGR
jgi:hypothetical protein